MSLSNTTLKSVTVYQKVAEVVRSFSVDLQLSSSIDTQSLRVSRLSDNASVLDVHCEVDASNASLLGDSETRRSLLSRKRELDDERKVQDQGLSLFVDYARTLNSAHTAPGDAVNFLDAFVAGRRSTVATIRKLDDEIAEIDQALTGSDPNVKGEVNGRATLVIVVSEPCTAEVDIVYNVKNASWEPYYNLHATTANGQPTSTVSLQYNARVTHMSGEDWSDIEFNFVAADAPRRGHNTDIPSVTPRRLHRLPTPLVSAFPPSSQTSIWPNGGFQPFSGPDSGRGFLGFGGAQQGMTHNPPVAQIAGVSFGSAPPNQSSHGPSLFGSPVVPPAQPLFGQAGGGLFGSQASNPANSIQPSTTKAPSLFAPKPKIDNGKGSAVPDMCVTALGENIVIRESTSTHEVRLAAETKASVASDGVGHAVPITSLVLAASFTWVCVPRSRTAAFVECHTKNSSTHTLVAGPLTVYIDGQEVAKTTLPDIQPNVAFLAPLGVDDAVRIALRRTARTEEAPERPFVERLWTTACTARYAVTNGHAFGIPRLLLRDALPVSTNPQIAIVVKTVGENAPHAGNGNTQVLGENVREPEGKEGMGLFEWVRSVEAGQTVLLHAEWEIHTPAGVSWEEKPV